MSKLERLLIYLAFAFVILSLVVQVPAKVMKKRKYKAKEVIGKTPKELIELRGFDSEVHYVVTSDGYHLQVVRIINPKVKSQKLKRPVLFNHGLIESATIWLLNTFEVEPEPIDDVCDKPRYHNETIFYRNTAMMLANSGYDVWLMSMRGTDYSLGHDTLSPEQKQFWNYSLDEFGLIDVPSVVNYIRETTGSHQVGYIGHSQATFAIFSLLSLRPYYAEVIEPVIAVAPVAFVDHTTSYIKPIVVAALATSPEHGPWPNNARKLRKTMAMTCAKSNKKISKKICDFMMMLVGGKGIRWLGGHYAHLPFYSSLKVLRHFKQVIESKRYAMFDYGKEENLIVYGQELNPNYQPGNIRSKSLVLIYAKGDVLSTLPDIEHFKRQLNVPLLKDIFIDLHINHFDLVIDTNFARRVSEPVLDIFERIEHKSGICSDRQTDLIVEEKFGTE